MDIIYVGITSGTSGARLRALQDIGNNVKVFDYTKYFNSATRFGRLLGYVLFSGAGIRRANKDLIELAQRTHADVIWIDKADWIYPMTLRILRRDKNYLVHHVTDALFPSRVFLKVQRRYLLSNNRYFDTIFTTNRSDCAVLRSRFGDVALHTRLGYDHRRFMPLSTDSSMRKYFESDVVFVGHHEPRTELGIRALIQAGFRIRVYGVGWHKTETAKLLGDSTGGAVDDTKYVHLLQTAKIALGYISEWNYNETAGRSYEIPACGTFFLGYRTAEHLETYNQGTEAVFFQTEKELCDKVRLYLSEERLREKIAFAGWNRCVSSGYSYHDIMVRDWNIIASRLKATR